LLRGAGKDVAAIVEYSCDGATNGVYEFVWQYGAFPCFARGLGLALRVYRVYVAMYMPYPGLVVSAVATARVAWRYTDKDLMSLMVGCIKATGAKYASVVCAASFTPVCSLAILEYMSTWLSPRRWCIFRALYCALGVAKAPWLLLI
jgi:hypothetical protein